MKKFISLFSFILSAPIAATACISGIPCGNSCISASYTCHIGATTSTTSSSTVTPTYNFAPTTPVQRLPESSGAVARDKNGNILSTTAKFTSGISIDNATYLRKATVKFTDKVGIHTKITHDSSDIGKQVNLIITASYKTTADSTPLFFMLSEYTQIKAWDQKTSSLIPFTKLTASSSDLEISAYEGNFVATGILEVFIHYQLDDGTLKSATDPIEVTIQ
ncbi:MAG: hypothetical protein PHP00_02970 [Thiotrichaceae bacterium]|nr:hypothetical protein [Thiotrichaceae bacterium]